MCIWNLLSETKHLDTCQEGVILETIELADWDH